MGGCTNFVATNSQSPLVQVVTISALLVARPPTPNLVELHAEVDGNANRELVLWLDLLNPKATHWSSALRNIVCGSRCDKRSTKTASILCADD